MHLYLIVKEKKLGRTPGFKDFKRSFSLATPVRFHRILPMYAEVVQWLGRVRNSTVTFNHLAALPERKSRLLSFLSQPNRIVSY